MIALVAVAVAVVVAVAKVLKVHQLQPPLFQS
jgi:hypothetical protein